MGHINACAWGDHPCQGPLHYVFRRLEMSSGQWWDLVIAILVPCLHRTLIVSYEPNETIFNGEGVFSYCLDNK